jgi:hypothetical protein
MLTISGSKYRLCDGATRRDFLKVGALAVGGLTLPELLRAEAEAGTGGSQKSVIMIYMCGAPSHHDMYDLKRDAPAEIRGEFRPIGTNVPGIQICEHLPRLAAIMDKLVPLRSVHGSPSGAHDSFICYTGRSTQNQPPGGWPSVGSTISRLRGPANEAVPPFIGLAPNAGHPPYGSPGLPGFLGVGHAAFRPSGPARADMTLSGVTLDRLDDRKNLLGSFDRFRRQVDASGTMRGMDQLAEQAMSILTSSRLAEALDLSQEDPAVRERYGKGDPKNYGDGAPRNLEHFLMARRLVEAGARVVTLNFGRWDFHSNNFSGLRETHLPLFDQGLSALIEDLHERGLDKDVSVVAWGIRAHTEDQHQRRSRSLAGGRRRPAGGRRNADRPGDRRHRPPGRRDCRPARPFRRSHRHALSSPGHRRPGDHGPRSCRTSPVSRRRPPPTARIDLDSVWKFRGCKFFRRGTRQSSEI